MTVSPLKQAQQIRTASYGPQLVSAALIPPSSTGTLWTVANGSISITSVTAVCVTAMSATATTLSVGTAAGAATLISAQTITSMAAGAIVATTVPTLASPVVANVGTINWIASAVQTGTMQIYVSYVLIDSGATVG
jgi:hypothetical protein